MKGGRLLMGLLFLGAFVHSGAAAASVLGDLATALPVGAWVKMPPNASLDGLDMDDALLYWTDSAAWDPVHKQLKWVGSAGSCCGDTIYRLVTYDEASDTWEITQTPFSGSGHSYDGNAVDPATGTLYFGQFGTGTTRVWDGQSWSNTPPMGFTGTTPSLAWFPELNGGKGGLIFMGDAGALAWYDGAAWKALPSIAAGAYNNFSEYNPVHKLVWLGSGNGASNVHFKMNESFEVTKLQDAPFDLGVGDALHSVDPVTGKHIAVDISGDGSFWEFDVASDSWSPIPTMTGDVPTIQSDVPTFQVAIPEYGMILFFKHYFDQRDVYLYRHSPLEPGTSTGSSVASTSSEGPASAGVGGAGGGGGASPQGTGGAGPLAMGAPSAGETGCSCSAAGDSGAPSTPMVAVFGLLGMLAERRLRRVELRQGRAPGRTRRSRDDMNWLRFACAMVCLGWLVGCGTDAGVATLSGEFGSPQCNRRLQRVRFDPRTLLARRRLQRHRARALRP